MTLLLLASALLGGAALLVLAELLTRRWFLSRGNYVWQPYDRMQLHLDQGVLPGLPPVARFQVNRNGERGSEPPADPASVCRLLVVGGSAAECYFLDQECTWPEVMARELGDRQFLLQAGRGSVHVGSLGKSGIDTSHVNFMFDSILHRYQELDVMIFFVGAGDVVNWLCSGAPDPFVPRTIRPAEIFGFVCDRNFSWSLKKTALSELARNIRGRYLPQVRRGVGKKLGEVRLMRRNARHLIDEVPSPQGMLEHFEANLRQIIAKAQGRAKKVLVVRQPWFDKDQFTPEEEKLLWHAPKGRPYEHLVDTYYSYAVFNSLMRQMDQRTVQLCEQLGIPALDLKAALPNDSATYYDHLHFTAAGAARVGRSVADFVKRAFA